MNKSPDAFKTISEVAEDLDLPQHVLRFWETRFTQIKPMKRGGGRRYYRPQDVEYTIKGVQRLLRENNAQFIIALGNGDVAAVEAITRQKQAVAAQEAALENYDPEEPRQSSGGRKLFGLLRGDEEGPMGADNKRLNKDNRTLLQEALFDLLECKRLLDQVR
jgi:DNA-binding transcriptional MerR regulator